MATINVAAAQIVSSKDQTELVEQQTEGKETAKNKQKAAKVMKDKTRKTSKDKTNDKTEKEPALVWTDDEVELLLKGTLEYKVSKASSCIDWESVRSKYADIWQLMRAQLPNCPKEAEELGKDYPHSKDEITKQVIASKLKGIRLKYRLAVDSGRKSGHGRVVLLYFEWCEKIWDGSPATEQIGSGIETTDLEAAPEGPDTDVSLPLSSTVSDTEKQETANISGGSDEGSRVAQRRAMLDEKLSSYKQKKLKRKLPADVQLAQNAKEELELKRRLLGNIERMDREYSEAMATMSTNMDKLTNSIADGFSLLRGLLLPQQTMYPPPMFRGHQQNMYPPMHSMYTGHQQPIYHPQQGTFSGHQHAESEHLSPPQSSFDEEDDSSFTDPSFSSFSPQ